MAFYDSKIKQLFEKCPRLVIETVNSIFGKEHSLQAKVVFLNTEQQKVHKSFMDMLVEIEEVEYHFEFQLLEDRMAIRMYEYGVQETLKKVQYDKGKDNYVIQVVMPRQAVIFLAGANKKDEITVYLTLPDGQEVTYRLPCVSASQTVEELMKKKLYILIPFQQVQLNERMNGIKDKSARKKQEIAEEIFEYHTIVKRELENLRRNGILTAGEFEELIDTFSDVEGYIVEKDQEVRQEVDAMGDEDYICRTDRARAEAREEGREEGRNILLINMICRKLKEGKTLEQIMEDWGSDEEEIQRIVTIASSYAPEYDCEAIYEELITKNKVLIDQKTEVLIK